MFVTEYRWMCSEILQLQGVHTTAVLLVKVVVVGKEVCCLLCFLLGNSPASEFYMPTFRNTLFHLHRQVGK